MDNELIEVVNNWMKKAESDIITARILLASNESYKPYDAICFHCQQAVEKYLKGYLIYLDVMFTKTHNLGALIDMGSKKDPDLKSFLPVDALSSYGVDIRYPDNFYMPSGQDAQDAYDIALAIQKYALSKIVKP